MEKAVVIQKWLYTTASGFILDNQIQAIPFSV